MTVQLGVMQLPAPEDADRVRDYLNGTIVTGGLWTALTRSSNHDHTGGVNGTPLSIAAIPDGSITTAKLDPSVLLPYALVDGSKPFTGQVTMQADAIVRDALYFGQQGTALAPDVTLSRTAAGALRLDNNLGVGVNPAAWYPTRVALQVGATGALWAATGTTEFVELSSNEYLNASSQTVALVTGPSTKLTLSGGGMSLANAPSVTANATQTFTTRASISPTGTLTLTPDDGQAALLSGSAGFVPASGFRALALGHAMGLLGVDLPGTNPSAIWSLNTKWVGGGQQPIVGGYPGLFVYLYNSLFQVSTAPAVAAGNAQTFTTRMSLDQIGTLTLTPAAGQAALAMTLSGGATFQFRPNGANSQITTANSLELNPGSAYVTPVIDNFIAMGHPSQRFSIIYAANGTIQTSSAEMKQDITPLDPAACYEAAKAVRWYDYRYQPPAYTEPEPGPEIAYDASDSNEVKAEKKALRDEAEAQARASHARMVVETAPARHQRGFVFAPEGEAKDDLGTTLPPVPDLFGLDDRQSTTPQADLATLGCAMQEIIRRLEALETRPN